MNTVETNFAYPCTRANIKVGKILSERMISTLVKLVEPERACFISSSDNISDPYDAYLLDGYFFSNPVVPNNCDRVYFYTSSNDGAPMIADFFPELYVDDLDNGCLFCSEIGEPDPGVDGEDYQLSDGNRYLLHLFNVDDIKSFDQVRCPYYIAAESDNKKKHKIWIKSDTMNPYVYVEGTWVPLGAVYKQTP